MVRCSIQRLSPGLPSRCSLLRISHLAVTEQPVVLPMSRSFLSSTSLVSKTTAIQHFTDFPCALIHGPFWIVMQGLRGTPSVGGLIAAERAAAASRLRRSACDGERTVAMLVRLNKKRSPSPTYPEHEGLDGASAVVLAADAVDQTYVAPPRFEPSQAARSLFLPSNPCPPRGRPLLPTPSYPFVPYCTVHACHRDLRHGSPRGKAGFPRKLIDPPPERPLIPRELGRFKLEPMRNPLLKIPPPCPFPRVSQHMA